MNDFDCCANGEHTAPELNPITETRLCDARETVVAALVQGLDMESEDVEDIFMPGIDNQVRILLGHDAWVAWVR